MIKQAQCKICRKEGKKLMLKGERCMSSKCAIVKRNYPPGIHGAKNIRRKKTEYGIQLREKQRAKEIYGILEKQFRNYYEKSVNSKNDTGSNLILLLEMRLDNAIYRSGIAKSRQQARQLVGHGHFFINNHKVDIPSYQVKADDIIKIKESKANNTFFKALKEEIKAKKEIETPGWIHFNKEKLEIKILSKPNTGGIDQGFDTKLIIEFYSR